MTEGTTDDRPRQQRVNSFVDPPPQQEAQRDRAYQVPVHAPSPGDLGTIDSTVPDLGISPM